MQKVAEQEQKLAKLLPGVNRRPATSLQANTVEMTADGQNQTQQG
jgi:hypothetical protein